VERERLKTEEESMRLVEDKGVLDRSVRDLELELEDSRKTIQAMQQQLSDTEQSNAKRLIEMSSRHRQESELEIERLRTAQIQSERTLEARERAHRQRVKGLEEQVATVKDQLAQEIRRRQPRTQRSNK